MSNPQFAEVLESYGQEAPKKVSPTTGKETFAFAKTDQGMQDSVNSDRPIIAALAKARLAVKSTIAETSGESSSVLPSVGHYLSCSTITGRTPGGLAGATSSTCRTSPSGAETWSYALVCAHHPTISYYV